MTYDTVQYLACLEAAWLHNSTYFLPDQVILLASRGQGQPYQKIVYECDYHKESAQSVKVTYRFCQPLVALSVKLLVTSNNMVMMPFALKKLALFIAVDRFSYHNHIGLRSLTVDHQPFDVENLGNELTLSCLPKTINIETASHIATTLIKPTSKELLLQLVTEVGEERLIRFNIVEGLS